MTNVIAKFHWDCGRMGDVDGLITTTREKIAENIGKEVYFGEILGKHSEIDGELNEEDFTILTDDQDFIEKFEKIIGSGTISGYNPFDYINQDEEE
jgi:hypothetical protein